MIGPVFRLEMLRAARRGWLDQLRLAFVLVLGVEAGTWLAIAFSRMHPLFGPKPPPEVLAPLVELALSGLAWQQLLALVLAVPAFVAGSITDEKTSGTLDHLLTAPLSGRDIVVGKWAAAVVQMGTLVLPGTPLLALAVGVAGLPPAEALEVVLWPLWPLPALAALALAVSALSSRTAPAILLQYLLLAPLVAAAAVWPGWMPTGWAALWWLAPAPVGLLIAASCLRPVYTRGGGVAQSGRPAGLPPIQGNAVRWKERVLSGQLPVVGWVPTWMGVLASAAGAVALQSVLLSLALAPGVTLWGVVEQGGPFAPPAVWAGPGAPSLVLFGAGLVFLAMSALLVGARAAVSVSGERERGTWETLLLIPATSEQVLRGKLWGLLDAAWPFQLAYLAGALPGALLVGIGGLGAVALPWLAGWLVMYFTAAVGLDNSTRVGSSWQALLWAVFISVRTVAERAVGMGALAGMVGAGVGYVVGAPGGGFLVGVLVVLAPLLLAEAERHIELASQWVSENERMP